MGRGRVIARPELAIRSRFVVVHFRTNAIDNVQMAVLGVVGDALGVVVAVNPGVEVGGGRVIARPVQPVGSWIQLEYLPGVVVRHEQMMTGGVVGQPGGFVTEGGRHSGRRHRRAKDTERKQVHAVESEDRWNLVHLGITHEHLGLVRDVGDPRRIRTRRTRRPQRCGSHQHGRCHRGRALAVHRGGNAQEGGDGSREEMTSHGFENSRQLGQILYGQCFRFRDLELLPTTSRLLRRIRLL